MTGRKIKPAQTKPTKEEIELYFSKANAKAQLEAKDREHQEAESWGQLTYEWIHYNKGEQ